MKNSFLIIGFLFLVAGCATTKKTETADWQNQLYPNRAPASASVDEKVRAAVVKYSQVVPGTTPLTTTQYDELYSRNESVCKSLQFCDSGKQKTAKTRSRELVKYLNREVAQPGAKVEGLESIKFQKSLRDPSTTFRDLVDKVSSSPMVQE